jgi:hypothetical protein
MPDAALRDFVLKRLDADTKPEDAWSALVLAALEGPAEFEKLLEDGAPSPRGASVVSGPEGPAVSAPESQRNAHADRGLRVPATPVD